MYITAHRVTTSDGATTGINCFRHKHGYLLGVDGSWDNAKVDDIAYQHPGKLIAQDIGLPPGGNRVLSYLDVIAEDATPPDTIVRVLQAYELLIGSKDRPKVKFRDCVIVRFSLVLGLTGKEGLEYPTLSNAIAKLMAR